MSGEASKNRGLNNERLPFLTKLVYGTGDWGMASYGTLRYIFYAKFLTDVVGLEARLASFVALIGLIWDAINDPLVGRLSDGLHSRWGRRRPFLLIFSIPFALSFMLMWWAPPWQSQAALMITMTLTLMISDTLQTLVIVPYLSLTPEMTQNYNERTSVTGYRMFFNLLASLCAAAGAPEIRNAAINAGLTAQQASLIIAALFGALAAIPFLLIFFVVHERYAVEMRAEKEPKLSELVRTIWKNIPFRYATTIYMLNWMTFDLVSLMLPFFLIYWVAGGNLLATVNLFGINLALESAVLGLLLITAILALPFWVFMARRFGKRHAYIIGMSFWAVVQLLIFMVQPGQVGLVLGLAVLAGLSVSTAHVLPDAIFPDVIEWDELRTRRRQEGIYYGAKNYVRKLSGAFATFFALQMLGWFGYQTPPAGDITFAQPSNTLTAIRWLTGPMGAILLISAIIVTWFYPLTRQRYERVRRLLEKRRQREANSG